MDLQSLNARRITSSRDMDSRPEWFPDGKALVFIRDSGSSLSIISLDFESGGEKGCGSMSRTTQIATVRSHLHRRQEQPRVIQNLFLEKHVRYAARSKSRTIYWRPQ